MKNTRTLITLTSAAALMVTLSACSGGEQSVAEACGVIEAEVTAPLEGMATSLDSSLGDMMYGIEVDLDAEFAPLLTAMDEAGEKVSNTEVKEALTDFRGGFQQMVDVLQSVELPNLDSTNMTDPEAIAQAEEASQKLSEALGESSRAFEASTVKIAELCEGA